jgi:3-methylcrotonyl-CoA carboxylase alpha subunit
MPQSLKHALAYFGCDLGILNNPMFSKLLIANRGEIACRIAATARRLGIRTVAVYSDVDAHAAHIEACDEAWPIGPAPARASYLNIARLLAVARESGAQAVHPGYGFLSENAEFARSCAAAGLIFVGPPAFAIEAMGSKSAAKQCMAQAGIALVPGYHGDQQAPDFLAQEAERIGWPVLIKATAGGGGKGIRIVRHRGEFEAQLIACQREARSSFGDDRVLLERYLVRARHVEVQIFCDQHGGALWLSERDCSVQRRHQKIIEEAPAPNLGDDLREALGQAAVTAARAVNYVGAGTVEFLVACDESGRAEHFYFMEMNTRLQVEHPVTELITGLDLVEWQLRVAAGERLPLAQSEVRIQGHAIEARLCAENPARGFLPATGRVLRLVWPEGVRIDSGVRAGDHITPHYDSMIAKLIVDGRDRAQALERLTHALNAVRIVGPATNLEFLRGLVRDTAFQEADLDTQLIERRQTELLGNSTDSGQVDDRSAHLALAALAVLGLDAAVPGDPWALCDGWRLGAPLERLLEFGSIAEDGIRRSARVTYPGTVGECFRGLRVEVDDQSWDVRGFSVESIPPRPRGVAPDLKALTLSVWLGVRAFSYDAVFDHDTVHLASTNSDRPWELRLGWRVNPDHGMVAVAEPGSLIAPMPGKVVALAVVEGQRVAIGDPLLVMEAMKMEHAICAPMAGIVEALPYAVGDPVEQGVALLRIRAIDPEMNSKERG